MKRLSGGTAAHDINPAARSGTGRYLILLGQDDLQASIQHLSSLARASIRHRSSASAEAAGGNTIPAVEPERTVYAIAGSIEEDHLAALSAVEGVCAVEPERMNAALPQTPRGQDGKMGGC